MSDVPDVPDVPRGREPGEMPWWWSWRDRLDRLPVEPSQVALAVVAVVVLLVAGAGWALGARARPSGPPTEELLPRADTTTTMADGAPGEASSSGEAVVHVAGAVAHPGLYRLSSPARVADAVHAAGGVTVEADLDRMNLAAPVADGERVYVPRQGEVAPEIVLGGGGGGGPPGPAGRGRAADAPAQPLDLNTATIEQLEALPGIGPATARAIVEYRTRHGPFRSVGQLLDVRGIGEAKLAALRSRVRT